MRKRRKRQRADRRPERRPERDWPSILGEAVLIAVVVVVPLAINRRSTNVCDVKDAALGVGVAIGLAAWLLASLRAGRLAWVQSRLNPIVIAFGLWAGVTITYSQYRFATVSEVGRLAAHVGLYVLAIVSLRSAAQVRRVIGAACLAAVPVCIYGFVQAAGRDPIGWDATEGRVFSFLGNATYLAGFLVLVIPLAVAAAWPRRHEGNAAEPSGGPEPAAITSVLFFIIAGMMLLCLYLSVTMSPAIGLVAGATAAGLIALVRGGRRLLWKAAPWIVLGAVVAGALGVVVYRRLPEHQQRRVQQVLRFQDPYGELRHMQWKVAYDLFREHPAVGLGYGTFRIYSLERLSADWYEGLGQSAEKMLVPGYAHNEYLQVLAGTGAVGGILFLVLLIAAYGALLRVSIRHPDDFWRRIGMAILAAATAFLVQNFFGITFRQTGAVTFFWLWLGVLALAAAWMPHGAGERPLPGVRELRFTRCGPLGLVLAGTALTVLVIVLSWYAVRPVMANMKLQAAKREARLAEMRPPGQEQARRQQYQEAAELAGEVIRLSPYSASAYYLIAYAWGQLGEYDKAIEANKQALELLPGSASVEYNLGVTYLAMGNTEEAEASFRRAIELMPTNATHHGALADVMLKQGRVEDALPHAEEALRLAPKDLKVHMLMADVQARRGENAEVLKHLRRATQLDPEELSARRQLCQLLLAMGNDTEAIPECKRWVQMEPASPKAHHALAMGYFSTKEYAAAKRALLQSLEIDPEYAPARLSLGLLLLNQGNTAQARAELERAWRAAPDSEAGRAARRMLDRVGPR
jgi:tetratricopeptide (TPR) repeat protein/O-antigen ligase